MADAGHTYRRIILASIGSAKAQTLYVQGSSVQQPLSVVAIACLSESRVGVQVKCTVPRWLCGQPRPGLRWSDVMGFADSSLLTIPFLASPVQQTAGAVSRWT